MMTRLYAVVLGLAIGVSANDVATTASGGELPQVNLGYATYRATNANVTGGYYNFSNIRYAAPPLGKLRFNAPAPPLKENGVQNGSTGFICSQSTPGYWNAAVTGLGDLLSAFPYAFSGQSQSEDCLFLDVVTPIKVFRGTNSERQKPVPVLVNIHGGGFFIGDKLTIYNPQGFIRQSQEGLVYVSMNYRLAAFGFLAGMIKSDANKTAPNAGLLDQRFALKWVQKYIHLFGGDPKQVTIMGQSAGGGSVEFHTTAYGGAKSRENNLFKNALALSPAPIIVDPEWQVLAANGILDAAGVRSVDELRRLTTQDLQAANQQAQQIAPYTVEVFAPSIDGDLIPDLPRRLYTKGQYIKGLNIMAAHQTNEGRLFTNQSARTNADYDNWILQNFPSASPDVRTYITTKLYPPVYDGSQPYKSPLERLNLTTQEYLIACNTIDMARAYDPHSVHNYDFGIPPAVHSQDLAYIFYNGEGPPVVRDVALKMQKAVVQFALTGNPNGPGVPNHPQYIPGNKVLLWLNAGAHEIVEAAANRRCDWWLKGLYAP